VHEIGSTNTGPQVDKYLEAAGVSPGNPWCASFVTWSLEQAGHKMPGSGWAAVSTWVRNAEQGSNGLKIVSADQARPGDIVAYDWGGQSDFGADGHIGFLDSTVQGGKFTALEGNNADAVNVVPRQLGGANIVFIRAEGNAPGGGVPDATPGGQVAPAKGDTLQLIAPDAKPASSGPARHDTLSLMAAPEQKAGVADIAPTGLVRYPGDDATKAQIAAWMSAEARKRGLPGELPVMASLVESGMRNLNYGDRDSVGFFQMRTEIWNSGPYAGYPDDPGKQLDWFLDQAEAVKKTRLAHGQSIDDPHQYGDWVADIERPAEQYRYRYQLQYENAHNLVQQAPAAPPADVAGDLLPAGAGGAGAKALTAVAEAKKYLGTPYQWGGSTPQTGFDCSGLMQWAYAHAGISIPRVSEAQILASNATPVDRQHLLPGDLVFFRDASGDVHHVGMSLGGDKFIHAPHTGDVVKVSSLNEPYYAEQFTGGRRFVPAGAGPAPDPTDVAKAHVHVARDAAEVRQHDSVLFMAVKAQEATKARATVQFLKAIDPEQAKAARGAAAPPAELAGGQPALDLGGVSGDYPGDRASQAELARWLGKQAEKAGLPPELPVMAALVESDVKNLNYGDRDSVGFFQMRTEIWDKGPYAGYPQRPDLQAKWFIDQALAVKRQRIADGNVGFGKDPSKWGDWIADVERPAEQYRGRYQLRLEQARKLLA
jgi:cell wall-associated NlpC family hydrolase